MSKNDKLKHKFIVKFRVTYAMRDWINENTDGDWHACISTDMSFMAFENEEDAVAFKIRWS